MFSYIFNIYSISPVLISVWVKCSTKKKGARGATTNLGKEEVLKISEGIILETLGPGGARVAFVNTIEETANAILSHIYIYVYIYIYQSLLPIRQSKECLLHCLSF